MFVGVFGWQVRFLFSILKSYNKENQQSNTWELQRTKSSQRRKSYPRNKKQSKESPKCRNSSNVGNEPKEREKEK